MLFRSSRLAGLPQVGQGTLTQESRLARGVRVTGVGLMTLLVWMHKTKLNAMVASFPPVETVEESLWRHWVSLHPVQEQ